MHQLEDSNGVTFLCERVDDQSGNFQTRVFLIISSRYPPTMTLNTP